MTVQSFPTPANDLEAALREAQADYAHWYDEWALTRSSEAAYAMDDANWRIRSLKMQLESMGENI
jgi:hypothetical protein